MLLVAILLALDWKPAPVVRDLKVGDQAPPFELEYLNKKKTFKLRDQLNKKPTVLIFGSYT